MRAKERILSPAQVERQKRQGVKGRCHEEPYSPRHSQDCQKLPGHFSLDTTMKTEALLERRIQSQGDCVQH